MSEKSKTTALLHRSSRWQMFFKKVVQSLINKLQAFKSATLKETPTQVFFYEYCKIFKNSFFYGTPPVVASGSNNIKRIFSLEITVLRIFPAILYNHIIKLNVQNVQIN